MGGVSVKAPKDYACEVCGEFFDGFAILDDLWANVAPRPNGKGLLCLRCCQERLGRQVEPKDFKQVPINKGLLLMYENGRNSVK